MIAYSRSARSLAVRTDVLISVSGKLKPRRDQISVPRTTVASTRSDDAKSTRISILPSFNRILSPMFNDPKTSASGNWTRVASPGVGSVSNVNFWPMVNGYLSSVSKLPMRCLGPCKSIIIATGVFNSFEISRIMSILRPWTSPVS